MKKLFALLVIVASVTVATAQTQPVAKSADKAKTATTIKKDCKKTDGCCKIMKTKTAATPTSSTAAKKN